MSSLCFPVNCFFSGRLFRPRGKVTDSQQYKALCLKPQGETALVFWKGSEKINPEKGSDWPVGIMCFIPGARVGSAPSEWTEWDYYRMGVGLSLKGCCLGETIMPAALTIPVCTRTHTHGYTHIHTYAHTLYLARRC